MIGVYDSGFGGLTVLRELTSRLPRRDCLYLGDSLRAPYGGRDPHTLLRLAEQCTEHLLAQGCRVVVVACHTVSCVALRHLQRRYAGPGSDVRVLGVSIPAAEAAVAASSGHIGVLATARTVASRTLEVEIAKLGPQRVTQRAASLLAPIVEEGWENTSIARDAVARYVAELAGVDTLLLACTHYPLLMAALQAATKARVLDPARFIAERLADWLERHPEHDREGSGELHVQCTGDAELFREHSTRFLGRRLPVVQRFGEEGHALAPYAPHHEAIGQVLR